MSSTSTSDQSLTTLEEMVNKMKNKLNKRTAILKERLSKIEGNSEGAIKTRVALTSALKSNTMAMTDMCHFENCIKKHLQYKGSEPNYLLMKSREAAGLYFSKHPNKTNGEQ